MKFTPDKNLIRLFVGQVVYSSPSSSIRELLQNARDACALQAVVDSSYISSIRIEYSRRGNWFTVIDNGLGMDQQTVEQSFVMIGRPKTEVEALDKLIKKGGMAAAQIGAFGVGVLSCFQIAQRVIVATKMDTGQAVKFAIDDPNEDFKMLSDDLPQSRGTSVKIEIKGGVGFTSNEVPGAVANFARHVDNLLLLDVDTKETTQVQSPYDGSSFRNKKSLKMDFIREGILALNQTWNDSNVGWANSLRVNNGGFLVQSHTPDLLPSYCFGYTGEIDLTPGTLGLMVNREGFMRDSRYQQFANYLFSEYITLLEQQLSQWRDSLKSNVNKTLNESIRTYLLILENNLPREERVSKLRAMVEDMLENLIQFSLFGSAGSQETTLTDARNSLGPTGTIYIYRQGAGVISYQSTESIDDDTTIHVTQQSRTPDIKATLLRSQGKLVFNTVSLNRAVANGSNLSYDIYGYLSRFCQKYNLHILEINQVADSELEIGNEELSKLIASLLSYPARLRFVELPSLSKSAIRDANGYWINYHTSQIRKVLKSIPDNLGNPIKKEILLIYLDVLTRQFNSARQRIERLVLDERFEDKSRQRTGYFTQQRLREHLEEILGSHENGSI